MTSSSSPGIALMQEGLGSIIMCELPCVIINVMRGGPGIGSIQPAQADYNQVTRGGYNGDGHVFVYAPASIQEAMDMIYNGFDIADEYRNPLIVCVDGMIGQMMEPVSFDFKINAAPEKPWSATGTEMKREHNVINSLYLTPEVLEEKNIERYEKYSAIKETEQLAEEYLLDDAEIVIAAFGIAARVAKTAIQRARAEGIKVGLVRPITLWPFPDKVFKKAAEHAKQFISVELSMGQFIEDVKLAIDCKVPVSLCFRAGGMIPMPDQILEAIRQADKERRA